MPKATIMAGINVKFNFFHSHTYMKKYINIALCAFLSALIGISCNTRAQNSETQLSKKDNETPKVYMFKEISPRT